MVVVIEQPDAMFGIHSLTLEFGATEEERRTTSALVSVLGAVVEILKRADEDALRQVLEVCQ